MQPDTSVMRHSDTNDSTPLACAQTTACEICNGPVPEDHEHVLDTQRCSVMCLCLACSEVFRPPFPRSP